MRLLLSLPAFLLLTFTGFAGTPPHRPNFVILLADDLGYGDLGCTGSTQIATPNIDSIAKDGAFCDQGYAAAPVCAPSRCGLMTGRSPAMLGNDMNIGGPVAGMDPEFLGLNVKATTVADRLSRLGYATALVGKWHLGDKPQFRPERRGFSVFHGFLGGGHDYFPDASGAYPDFVSTLGPVPKGGYLTDDLAAAGARIIRENKDRPLFLFMSFNAPHTPLQAPEADLKAYEFIKDKRRRTYCAMVAALDRGVGVVLKALKETGADRDTVVVFMSDNGGAASVNASCNAPWNGKKGTLLEGGVHVPFLVRWPAVVPAGSRIARPVCAIDLAPTFVALAGGAVRPGDFDGEDITDALRGATLPDRDLFWRFHGVNMIRSGDFKLISRQNRLPALYDLKNDILESENRLLKDFGRADALQRKLGRWVLACPDPLYVEGSSWARVQSEEYEAIYQTTQPARTEAPVVRKPSHE